MRKKSNKTQSKHVPFLGLEISGGTGDARIMAVTLDSTVIGTIVIANTASPDNKYPANTETWQFSTPGLEGLASADGFDSFIAAEGSWNSTGVDEWLGWPEGKTDIVTWDMLSYVGDWQAVDQKSFGGGRLFRGPCSGTSQSPVYVRIEGEHGTQDPLTITWWKADDYPWIKIEVGVDVNMHFDHVSPPNPYSGWAVKGVIDPE